MTVSAKDKRIIRTLAKKVAEIASDPINSEKRDMWMRLNRLERVRPLIQIQAIDWNIWEELIPSDQLETTDPFSRQHELELRKRLYCWDNFRDDHVVDNVIICPIVINGDFDSADFGIKRDIEEPEDPSGAHAFRPVIIAEKDIDKIQTDWKISVDWEQTERQYEQLCELFDGTLTVEKRGPDFFWFAPVDFFMRWRGMQQLFIDIIDRPQWIHVALERIITGYLNCIEKLERMNVLSLGNGNTNMGSGGFGWTDQLPQPDFDGEHVRLKDIWARSATQTFTEVSPDMHDEFAVQYEKRLLERFGLSCYGCCEPLDKKMHIVRKIGNLRRVSMSPWVDIARASEAVGRDYVYTYKPHPSIISMPEWDLDLAREQVRSALEKTRQNIVEVSLQDLHTVRNEPYRLTEWTKMAIQLAEEYA